MKRRVALITGSAKGLGKKTAFDLAEAGIDVVINYKSSEHKAQSIVEEISSLYGCLLYTSDAADE